jgi:hypothetical protein
VKRFRGKIGSRPDFKKILCNITWGRWNSEPFGIRE